MPCSNKNIVKNGTFADGLANWSGSHMKLVNDPLHEGLSCVLLGNKNTFYNNGISCTLKQYIQGPFEQGCAYYLHYKLMHAYVLEPKDRFYATVAYLDAKGRIITSTPVYIIPNHMTLRWSPYYNIVPPAPYNAKSLSVSFMLRGGMMYLGSVELKSETIKPVPKNPQEDSTEKNKEESIINYDAI